MAAIQPSEKNRLLRSLPSDDYQRLTNAGEEANLASRDVLAYPGEPTSHANFPRGAALSMLVPMRDGASVEAATVGIEGMHGLALARSDGIGDEEWICQVPGPSFRIGGPAFRKVLAGSPALRILLDDYSNAFISQIARTAGCNGTHAIIERCARWILMTRDRVDAQTFPLTHEFLAYMLGIRRASVTVAVGHLQSLGVIHYRRGVMSIVDDEGLEASACEDYARSNESYERLFKRLQGPTSQRLS